MLVAEGQAIVRQCLRHNQPGPLIQAAINAVDSDAPGCGRDRLAADRRALPSALVPAPNRRCNAAS
jgi:RNA polymerase sigma-70 factor, ECF subfamily